MDKPIESAPLLHPVVQECIDNYGKYYAEQHKLGMSVRSDMIYVAQLAIRWADNAAAGSGGQCVNVPRKLLEEILEHKSRMQYHMAMPYEGGNALDCVVRNILRESAQTADHCQPAALKEQG